MDFTVFKAFRYSFSEAIPIFFNRLKSVFFPCPIAIQFLPVIRTFAHSHSKFRIPKRAGVHFFPSFNAFLRTSFSCSILAILKDVIRRHNKFVFFFDLQNYGNKCITVP